MSDEFDDSDSAKPLSKSQRKRDFLALQGLAERLIGLGPQQWSQFGFGETLMATLEESRRVKGRSAMRRHVRRLGKLLQHEDTGRVAAALSAIDSRHQLETVRFHRLERWRDRLLNEGDKALEELLDVCPKADAGQLKKLVRGARQERDTLQPPRNARKLYKYIRELQIK